MLVPTGSFVLMYLTVRDADNGSCCLEKARPTAENMAIERIKLEIGVSFMDVVDGAQKGFSEKTKLSDGSLVWWFVVSS